MITTTRSSDRSVSWRSVSLRDCLLENPVYGANAASVDYDPDLPRYVRITDISDSGRLIDHGCRSITWKAARNNMLRSGDIAIARSGASVGKSYLHRLDVPMPFAGYLLRFRPDRSIVLPEFLFLVTRSTLFRRWLWSMKREGAQPNINAREYAAFQFPLPPSSEQARIVDVLDTWTAAIHALQGLKKAKQRQRRGLIQRLMTRPPSNSERRPRSWQRLSLGAILRERRDRSTGAEEVFSVSVAEGLVEQKKHLGRSFAARDTAHYSRVLPGDIVYTRSPTGDYPLGIIKCSRAARPVIVSPLYGVFVPTIQGAEILIDAWFESPVATANYLRPLVQKGAKNTISVTSGRFLQGKIWLPLDEHEYARIAAVLEASRAELAALDRNIRKLIRQKRGLMDLLLSGEKRLSVHDNKIGTDPEPSIRARRIDL